MNTSAYMGMDVEQAREVASAFTDCASRIGELIDEAGAQVRAMDWVGPDADTYHQAWSDVVAQRISTLTEALAAVADEITTHADQQDATSNSS